MRLLHRSGLCALALIAGSAALQFEPAVLRDMVFDNGTQRLAVGAVRTPLWSAAFAQTSDSYSIEKVRFTWGAFTYEAERLDFSGVAISRADIQGLFSAAEPMADRLARISARQVTAPEIKVTQKLGKEIQTILYRNVSLNDVVRGRIGSATIQTAAIEDTSPGGSTLTSYGRTTVSDLEMPAFAKLFETTDASVPLSRIYGAFSIENVDVVAKGEGFTARIARVEGRDIMARPTRGGWNGTMTTIAELADKESPSPEEGTRLMAAATDLLGAIDAGFIEAKGIILKLGKTKDRASDTTAQASRLAYTGSSGSQPAVVRMEEFEVHDQDNRVRFDTASLTGFSIAPTLKGLKDLEGKSLDNLDPATARSLVPVFGTLRISGIDVDAKSEGDNGTKSKPVKFTVKDFEFTADKPVNGLPANIRIESRNAAMALPANTEDEFSKELLGLGYKTFDTSFALAAYWNEAANEVVLKEVSVQGQDMGSIVLTGLIGNVTKDLFSPDQATAAAALIGVKAKSLDAVVEDKGLLSRYLNKTAKEQKTKPEDLRRSFASAAPLVLGSLIGSSEQAKTLSQSVARFITGPGSKLTVHVEPKNPSGFGMMDVMLASDAKAALEKLDVSAKVE